ncbi:TusE/DsrC/DsvC family sulfur relay protein [Buchnera aphidicola]|uniref:Sulfurtransferase n=1 Tax=Buchnera aphidicola subsp. Uroleucon sonchi TaxID=118118 RepID=A0A6C1F6P3_BUCUN|nr:TusE/DsrC/DsvC family sulfur relay protein [Buchnera aphidicola]QIE02151.1 TusE/DsrC/DsvC family sulfur relay protein [Buchnera aphidicola (Uroleucon sonchi)]
MNHNHNKIYENIEKDAEGYLKKIEDWNIKIAEIIAIQEDIKLNADHWKIIFFIRKFYLKFKLTPSMRMLIKSINQTMNYSKINSIYLFRLFPKGPAKQASKIAGIPKPNQCL